MFDSGPTSARLKFDPDFPRLRDRLIDDTGLAWYIERQKQLCERVEERLDAIGITRCADYLARLDDPQAGPPELDALIESLTVGETHFCRHMEQFEAICETAVPDIIERNCDVRRLHVWCAGCASGPEPYTLSILLRQRFGEFLGDWVVRILGTDISRRALAQAQSGCFGDWALRGTSDEIRRACFERAGKTWILKDLYRQWVSFRYHNLVQGESPLLSGDLTGFDLVLCRNVLIYFSPPITGRVIARLEESLVQGGWLAIGATDWSPETFNRFDAVDTGGLRLFRKAPPATVQNRRPVPVTAYAPPVVEPLRVPEPPVSQRRSPPRAPAITRAGAQAPSAIAENSFEAIRRLADSGEAEAAERQCKRLIESEPLDAAPYLLLAMLIQRKGEWEEAERLLRQAVYLDRKAPLAHYQLGMHLQQKRRPAEAARCLRNAFKLLAALPGDAVVPHCDGLTAAELADLVQIHLEVCG